MKYIMFEVQHPSGLKQKIPIIFPDQMVHKFVAEAVANHREHRQFEMKPVSAGQCSIECLGVFGESETLKVSASKEDSDVINAYDYMHGL